MIHSFLRNHWKPYRIGHRLAVLLLMCVTFFSAQATTYYVTVSGAGEKTGTNWENALDASQLATMTGSAQGGDIFKVAAGIYKPYGIGNDTYLHITQGIEIYGGYTVGTENRTLGTTILSGDIDDDNLLDGENFQVAVYFDESGANARLDGVDITMFRTNSGTIFGPAITFLSSGTGSRVSSPVIANCSIYRNFASVSAALVLRTTFSGVTSPTLFNCVISNNEAYYGGFWVFTGNGGGTANPMLINCVLAGNQGTENGAIYNQQGGSSARFNISLTNCIVWGNSATSGPAIYNNGGTITIINSDVQDTTPIGSIVSVDPQFVDAATGNFRLQSCSPLINQGYNDAYTAASGPTFDLAGKNRFVGTVDMGAYEFQGNFTVNNDPTASFEVCSGGTLSTSVQATSPYPITYQWLKGGVPLNPAQTTSTLSLTNVQAADEGVYYAVLTSGCESITAISVSLTVNVAPVVSISPSATAVCGGSVTLTASGADSYLWSTGATSSTISVTESRSYSVTGTTNACSSTATAGVTIYDAPPTPVLSVSPSVTQPILQNAPYVTLTVSGCSGGNVSWQGPTSSGTGTSISVPTSATGTLEYSATCTVGSCSSPPGSTTVTISPSLVSGSFDGFVNGADCSTFRGWAWDRNKVNTAIQVDILDGAKVITTLLADVFRQDLQTAGKGNGKHAFSFPIPESVKDGSAHNLSARVAGSSFILKDSPKALICQGTSSPSNKAPVPPSPTVLIAPLSAQVGVPFSGTLVAFTDPEGQSLTYALTGLPDGLSINMTSRVISGTPTQSGTFVLAYSANDGELTNSVSFPLTVNPQSTTTITGNFEGYLDKVECGTIRGWVWDRNKPNTPVTVEFYTDGTVWGSVVANIYRDDLKNAGKGNGVHAYSFTVPAVLKDNTTRLIYGRVQGSTYVLKDSGKPLTCASPSPVRLSAESNEGLQVTVLGNPVSDQLQVEVRGVEGQSLRLQLTDASGRILHEQQIREAKTVEQQTIGVHNQPSGLLLLRATSGVRSVTVKVLKK